MMNKKILVLAVILNLLQLQFAVADVNDSMEIYIVRTNKPKTQQPSKISANPPKSKANKMSISNNIYEKCFDVAGLQYNVSPNLLRVIAKVESNYNPFAVNHNTNGSFDMGLMQINSSWLPTLAKKGISKDDLWNGCRSIQIGAWILSMNIQKYGLTTEAIGRYNSANPMYKNKYAAKVMQTYKSNRQQLLAFNSKE